MREEFEQSRDGSGIIRLKTIDVIARDSGIRMPVRLTAGTKFSIDEYIVLPGNTIGQIKDIVYDKDKHCMVVIVDIVEYGTKLH